MKLGSMFFDYRFIKVTGEKIRPSCRTMITSETTGYAFEYAKNIVADFSVEGKIMLLDMHLSVPEDIRGKIGSAYSYNDEEYVIEITNEKIEIYALTKRGLLYAVSTIKHLNDNDEIAPMLLYDFPDKAVRGYRVYTPGRKSFDAFKKVIDMLVEYKYNTVMLEVGGAMEYKRRPEINRKWEEFCSEVNKSPYEAERIQKKIYPNWQKNSIHADNGGGSYITQDEMLELISYCRERELEVVPEVPSLSHSDYIVMTYPELNERLEDKYPDTYCPSNPKSYEVLFDILDEVIGVFNPEYVNIGHDECYTLAKCQLCKDKDPVDLYVGDIIKINDYLKARGIKAIMWSEKFIDNVYLPDENGVMHGYGGTGDTAWDVPRCIGCAGKVPKDITLLHWYWSLCTGKRETEVCNMGYKQLYGNFNGVILKNYRERIDRVDGGFVSNWGAFEDIYMQRNGQNYALLTTAYVFWNGNYDTDQSRCVIAKAKDELHQRYLRELGPDVIEICHTTDYDKPYRVFYDGFYFVEDEWKIGDHIVTYADGTEVSLPVIYGYNIRSESENEFLDSDSTEAIPTAYVEVLGTTYPMLIDGRMFYKTAYKNPYPEKKIRSIRTVEKDGINIEVKW